MSLFLTQVTAQANRCSSPPDKSSMFRVLSPLSSYSSMIRSKLSLSFLLVNISSTVPLMARGIWSTYCGLMIAFRLSSRILVKKFWSSEPRKNVKMSDQSGGSLNLPKLGFSLPARMFNAVDLPMPFVPTRPRTWPGRGVGKRCSLNEFGPKR
ncbi:hypothetical protein BpHYR1_026734 [Brachionus plicatilis]|uniref:Uncharacterized protein n=1 Tax=Brachionus plicatilis TaxID=10195 RepID=A0A3M7RFD3_BRAPC|nr:hypothetical protein BpHYR1_026734 [Brachionus plicatilis]